MLLYSWWFEFHLTPCTCSWLAVVLQMQLAYRKSLVPNILASQEWTECDAGTKSRPATQSSASLVARSSCGFLSCQHSCRPPWNCPRAACISGLIGRNPNMQECISKDGRTRTKLASSKQLTRESPARRKRQAEVHAHRSRDYRYIFSH